jgi:hypothetical protein
MSDTAFQTAYRDEFIAGYERGMSLLSAACTTQAQIKGQTAVFLVADSGSASAVTRGTNGLIPGRPDNLTQNTCTLAEWHDKPIATGFNIFASQGDRNAIMQMSSMKVINRKVDDDIIASLDTATNDTGAAVKASLGLVIKARTILGNNFVPLSEVDNLFMAVTPAFMGYMLQVKEFASSDYVDVKPFGASGPRSYLRYAGFNWIEHAGLTGVGTAAEKCYAFHRSALGHAVDKRGIQTEIDYNKEHDYSFCRVSGFFGTKVLQNSGIVQMMHDGSEYVAT